MKLTLLQTHPPLNSAHVPESIRLSYMALGYGNRVDYVLVDDGVYALLDWSSLSLKTESLKRLVQEPGFRLYASDRSARQRQITVPPACEPLSAEQIAEMLLSSKVLVF
ncbi:MAG: DsrE family protein [Thermoprotei archaeon]